MAFSVSSVSSVAPTQIVEQLQAALLPEYRVRFILTATMPLPHSDDAIIAFTSITPPDAFTSFCSQPLSQRPLFIWVVDSAITSVEAFPGDCHLEANSPLLLAQIHKQIQLHRANRQQLFEQIQQTQAMSAEISRQRAIATQMELLKNAIVRNISHELRTPLLQVKSAVSLIAEGARDDAVITYAQNATARLEALVKNITLLGSSLDVHPSPAILRDMVEYARRNLARTWTSKNAVERIRIAITPNLAPVYCDKQAITTVIQLLLDNALKFSEREVLLTVEAVDANTVKMSIRDFGIGIAQSEWDKIFETFYQIDSSSTRRYGGVGVGLAIVKYILDKHQVTIDIQSELGQGSVFSFKLPLVDMENYFAT